MLCRRRQCVARAEKRLRAKQPDRIHPVANLQEFFKDSVADAMEKQGVAADDHTAYYVVNLLTLFARAEKLYDRRTARPRSAAARAAARGGRGHARPPSAQRACCTASAIRRCSSPASSATAFARKLVDVDYYIDMGGAAYGRLSDNVRGTSRGRAFGTVFAELAEKFRDFVDVLAEIRDSGEAAAIDVLRLYEVWLRTGSRARRTALREPGIEPNATLNVTTRH